MQALLPFVLVMVALGYVMRRAGVLSAEAPRDLNHLVLYLTLPPVIFLAMRGARLEWSMLALPALAWGVALVGLVAGVALGRGLGLSRPTTGALALTLAFGNTTYFGYPVVRGFFGQEHLTWAIFFDLLGVSLAVNTLGAGVAATMGGRPLRGRDIARRLLLFPPILALVLGLALRGVSIPAPIDGLLHRLADITVPLIMLSIGLTLQFRHWRQDLGLVALITAGKLVVMPLLTWGLAVALGLPEGYRQAAVMQAGMPVMFYSLTLSLVFGLTTPLVVNAIMVSTLLSFATLPLWYQVLTR